VPIKEGQTTGEAVEGFIDKKESEREAESSENESGQKPDDGAIIRPTNREAINKELSELRQLGASTGNEHASIVTEGGEDIARTEGQQEQVVFTRDMIDMINNSPPNSLVIAHNHPGVGSFSDEDLSFLSYPSVKEIDVVEPNGNHYTMSVGSGEKPSVSEIMQLGRAVDKAVSANQVDMIINGKITPDQAFQRHNDEKCKIIAMEYGWIYERGTIDD